MGMRYWVYQASRILGPFTREDIASVPGITEGSRVCGEGASGAKEADWQPLESVPELAETALTGGAAGAADPLDQRGAGGLAGGSAPGTDPTGFGILKARNLHPP